MKQYRITFEITIRFDAEVSNYEGWLKVTCNKVEFSKYNECVFYADSICIELDERVKKIERYLPEENKWLEVERNYKN